MRKRRFSEDDMVKILREADKTPVAEVAEKHGVAEQAIYIWRQRFGKLEPADVKRLRHLEHEIRRIKKLVAERHLEIEVMKEVARRN
jgi:putative transposase